MRTRIGAPPTRPSAAIARRALKAFSDDQMTQHAAAISFYALMSLFPALLLALSLLGIIGQYPETYDAIMGYLRDVAPPAAIVPLDASLRQALQSERTAATAFVVSLLLALYGTTGVLEACRRALNVVFEVDRGRSFVRRKLIDTASTLVLMTLILTSLVLVFVGGGFAEDVASFIGLGPTVAAAWNVVRWPTAVAVAILVFALIYYLTPDVHHRAFRWITPGAVVGVIVWLAASFAFSTYVSNVGHIGAIYGTFAGAILLVAWLFLTSVALLLGAEIDAEIERQAELQEGVPRADTLNRPPKRG